MSRFIDLIRRVVQQELAHQRGSAFGVVSTIFPHDSEDDDNNYEVNVRLKYENLELLKVPVAVGHMGIAAPPKVGDLVLVQFINNDLNQPVVIGRFYHADERPPLHEADDILFAQRTTDGKLNHLRFAADGTIFIQREVTSPKDNNARAGIKIDASGNIEIHTGDEVKIEVRDGGHLVKVTCDTLRVEGNLEVNGTATLTGANHSSTVIDGNQITGTGP